MQPRQKIRSCILRVDIATDSVTSTSCKLFFCHDSLENVGGSDVFEYGVLTYQLPNKDYLIQIFKLCPFFS